MNRRVRHLWREFYIADTTDWREWQSAWASHASNFPHRSMRFPSPGQMATNLSLRDLAHIRRFSFVRHRLPDYVTYDDREEGD